MAAGLKIRFENFAEFRSAMNDFARRKLTAEQLAPELKLEAVAEFGQTGEAMVSDLQRLGPFGHGNRRPVLCYRDVTVVAPPRRVGKTGDHLQLQVRQGTLLMKCIAFGAGNWCDQLNVGSRVHLAAEPTLNSFNGRTTVELEVKDLQTAK